MLTELAPPRPVRRLGDVCGNTSSCCAVDDVYAYQHAAPQAFCLLADAEMRHLAVDWVGRTENFEADFDELLALLNARPGVPLLPPSQLEPANMRAGACYEGGGAGGGSGGADGIRRFDASASQQLEDIERTALPSPWLSQLPVSFPCNTQAFYSGAYRGCHGAIATFYAEDVRLLHAL